MKTLKRISILIAILSSTVLLNACSSGDSDDAGALNLTGRWEGAGTFFNQNARFFAGTMTLSQLRPTQFEGEEEVTGSMTLVGQTCVFNLAFVGSVNGRTNTISIRSTDGDASFVATASNSEIVGNLTNVGGGDDCKVEGSDSAAPFVSGPTRWTRVRG